MNAKQTDNQFNDVLKRMLGTPPAPRKKRPTAKKPKANKKKPA